MSAGPRKGPGGARSARAVALSAHRPPGYPPPMPRPSPARDRPTARRSRGLCAPTLAAALLTLLGCQVPRPEPAALVATGFRTPEQTFATFQSALAADLIDLEYRCFGSAFKRREGLSQLAWRAWRAELLSTWPAVRRLATAQITRSEALAPDRWFLAGRVEYLWLDFDFEVELTREDFYELYIDGQRALDDNLVWDGVLSIEEHPDPWGTPSLFASVPVSEPIDPNVLTEVRLGREWKIDALRRVDA